ncbi:hypothetical protein EJ04DRAFT_577902 [Polyplosphaeria fusca]|uniref:Uncharacterized protein n=1 Tax=Polyplosphaeria fusca TaxID=682080 RepID=A0A9P4QY53_9PLEO|nr:hypothetical protein EJ04DRAFT_577902 [Polyplosphaeria fusca]
MSFLKKPKSMHFRLPSIGSSAKIVKQPKLPTVTEAAPKSGDLPIVRAKGQKVTAEEVRELRGLIRTRYYLDNELWILKDAKYYNSNKTYIYGQIAKADATLRKIKVLVESWDKREYFSSDKEYEKFKDIKARVMADGKREWSLHPPWEEAEADK